MSKSAIYTANTSAQAVAIGGTVNLGSVVRRFGCAIDLSGNAITIDECGYYDINISATVEPTAIGTVTLTLLNNGVEVTGATASEVVSAANDPASLSFESVVRVFCGNSSALTVVLTGTASNVSNIAVVVTKL